MGDTPGPGAWSRALGQQWVKRTAEAHGRRPTAGGPQVSERPDTPLINCSVDPLSLARLSLR